MPKLFVGNLSYQTTEEGLKAFFEADGKSIDHVKVVTDRESGRSRGFAFIEFASDADAQQAMETLDGKELDGRPLRIAEAHERDSGGGGGGGRY